MRTKTDMVDGALAPQLTKWDLRVLKALPAWPPHDEPFPKPLVRMNEWEVARLVREDNVKLVRDTLYGLYGRHLVYASAQWQNNLRMWVRSHAGNEYLEERRV